MPITLEYGQIAHVSEVEILATYTPTLFDDAVERAAAVLRSGELVALPTETVYGLAANALEPEAVEKIFAAKGRPERNPIIVHVEGISMARECVAVWPDAAAQLAKAFWPGPLTLVLPKADCIPTVVTAGGGTVGVRWSSHPLMQAVIRACRFPLAAPSANMSSHISPTNAEHVRAQMGEALPLIVDGGQSQVGIESAVVEILEDGVNVLRPGMISRETIATTLPGVAVREGGQTDAIKSPGRMPRHYSPTARLLVLEWSDDEDLEAQIKHSRTPADRVCVVAHTVIPPGTRFGRVSVIPHDAKAYGRALYGELHRCDAEGAELIVVEKVPEGGDWEALADRLARAQA